jgi:hypothetical protein
VTVISIFRTSFIWVQTVPAILSRKVSGPYGFLGARGDYVDTFKACQSGALAAGVLALPWAKPEGNHYWRYYFEGQEAGEVSGEKAWKMLVPFCRKLDIATVSPDKPEARVTFDMYYAPQGLAAVARVNYRGVPKSPAEVAKLAHAVRYDYRFLPAGIADPPGGLSLDRSVEQAFAQVRRTEFGNADGFAGGGEPMSVTTFLQGANVRPVAQGSDEHLLLEAVTSWRRNLALGDLATRKLAEAQLASVLNADAENMIYARGRGRAIWFPREFVGNSRAMLPCYHQNTVVASLQTQSLGALVVWVASQLAQSNPVDPGVLDRAKRAAALLKIFANGGTAGLKTTYRSASVQAQIANAKWDDAMKAVAAQP